MNDDDSERVTVGGRRTEKQGNTYQSERPQVFSVQTPHTRRQGGDEEYNKLSNLGGEMVNPLNRTGTQTVPTHLT